MNTPPPLSELITGGNDQFIDLDDDEFHDKTPSSSNMKKRLLEARGARGSSEGLGLEDSLVYGQQYYGRLDAFVNRLLHSRLYLLKMVIYSFLAQLIISPAICYALSIKFLSLCTATMGMLAIIFIYIYISRNSGHHVGSGKNVLLVILDDANALGIFGRLITKNNNVLAIYFNADYSEGIEHLLKSHPDTPARIAHRCVDATELEGIIEGHSLIYEFFEGNEIDSVIWTQHHSVKYDVINKYVDMNMNLNIVWPYFFLKELRCKRVIMLNTPDVYSTFGDGSNHCCMKTWTDEILSNGCVIFNSQGLLRYMALARVLVCKLLREKNPEIEYINCILPLRDSNSLIGTFIEGLLYDHHNVEAYITSLVWKPKVNIIELYDYSAPGKIPPFGNSNALCQELLESCEKIREQLRPYFKHDKSKNLNRLRSKAIRTEDYNAAEIEA